MSKRICVFGDSITWGAFDDEKGGWTTRLKIYIESIYSRKYSIYNFGVDGDTTKLLLQRLNKKLQSICPKIVIIAEGINDSLFYQNIQENYIDINDFKNNLTKILTVIKKFTPKVIFIGLTKVEEFKVNPFLGSETGKCYDNENIKKYDLAIKNFCKENNLPFIEMFDLLKDEDLEDGLHPNAQGHEKMFQRVKDFLVENKII